MSIQDIQLKQSDAYLSNPNLKRANTTFSWTEEQVIEFLKCKEDPVYFAKNYIKIVSLEMDTSQKEQDRDPEKRS